MKQNHRHFCTYGVKRANLALSLLAAGAIYGATPTAHATSFGVTSLVTDDSANLASLGFPAAATVDPSLVNPWGISFAATSPFWVSDNGTGLTTLYTAAGTEVFPVPGTPPSPVIIAPPAGSPSGTTAAPTGQVFNIGGANDFVVSSGGQAGRATFIFATEDGTISGWPVAIRPQQTFLSPVDNSGSGAVYKGLAIAATASGTFLYAANFNSGNVEMYNSSWGLVKSFTDPTLPAGYAPFNVQVLNGKLYVTFALQNDAKHDDVAGLGNGFVDVFNLDGTPGLSGGNVRLISNGDLNSPWGLAIAPLGFGQLGTDLLVGNFGDGEIHAFDPTTGAPIGTLDDINGNAIVIPGLWAITAGNRGAGVDPNAIYFTAGLPEASMPDELEKAGLFGDLAPVPEPGSLALLATGLAGLIWFRRRRAA